MFLSRESANELAGNKTVDTVNPAATAKTTNDRFNLRSFEKSKTDSEATRCREPRPARCLLEFCRSGGFFRFLFVFGAFHRG